MFYHKSYLFNTRSPKKFNSSELPVFDSPEKSNGISNFLVKKEWEYDIIGPQPSFNEEFISLSQVLESYEKTCLHKRTKASCFEFGCNLIPNIYKLYRELNNGTYEISPSSCFCVTVPVKRGVFAADFRDRIVHHIIVGRLQPYLEKLFLKDVYACIPRRGPLYGVQRLLSYINECEEGNLIKLDIKSYFVSINKVRLYALLTNIVHELLDEKNKREWFLWLVHKVVFDCPQFNCIVRQSMWMWNDLPKDKSLFCRDKNHGMPIGNHTSQWFANLYLVALDMFITETLGLKMHGRYVDDFYIIVPQDYPLTPQSIIKKIREFLSNIGITLHPNKIYIQPSYRGCDFIGFNIKPNRIFLRKRTKHKFIKIVYEIKDELNSNITKDDLILFRATLNSYIGMMSNTNSYNIKKDMKKKHFDKLFPYFVLNKKLSKFIISKSVIETKEIIGLDDQLTAIYIK